jgi:hypothetical protein
MGKNNIIKAFNDELRQATYVCMLPIEDAHGDNTSIDEIRKACHAFNRSPKRANLFHKMMTTDVEFVESFILPTDINIADSNGVLRYIPKGSWLVVSETSNDAIWEAQKNGTFSGVSIGALGERVEIETEEQ